MRYWQGAFGAVFIALAVLAAVPLAAASDFADPAFRTPWQAGEAIAPNFWGPLANARDGQQERYQEAQGGQRLVQYFDKGRMELTNGAVTNGLLATELLTGQLQLGDSAFETRAPADVPMAGDPIIGGITPGVPQPTYAIVNSVKQLTGSASTTIGVATTTSLQRLSGGNPAAAPIYAPGTYPDGSNYPLANIATYDDPKKHNVPKVFADYRERASLKTIGYAITEPFWSPVKVAGETKQVLIQVFERRVLTYTPDNPDPFTVEMGNVGQHYYAWRYRTSAATSPTGTSPTAVSPTTPTTPAIPATAPPSATAPQNTTGIEFRMVQGAAPGGKALVAILGPPSTTCTIAYTAPSGGVISVDGLVPKTTTSIGLVSWMWTVPSTSRSGTGMIAVTCAGKTASTPITIT